jgi:hypothetical protein
MKVYTYITHELGRELAEKQVYMKWWFEVEPADEPDSDHVYYRMQAYSGDGTMEDFAIILAADCEEDYEEMHVDLCRLIRKYVALINIPNDEK